MYMGGGAPHVCTWGEGSTCTYMGGGAPHVRTWGEGHSLNHMQQNIAALLFNYFTRSTLEASLSCRIKCVVYFSSIFENKYILKSLYNKV